MEPAPVGERQTLASRRRGSEEGTHLVGRTARHALEPVHWPLPALDAAMILLEMIVQVAARPVDDPLAEVGLEGAGTGIMTLTRCGVILATACAEAKTASAAA